MSSENNKKHHKAIISGAALLVIIGGYSLLNDGTQVKVIENTESAMVLNSYTPKIVASIWQGNQTDVPSAQQLTEQLSAEDNTAKQTNGYSLNYTMLHEEIGKIRLTEDGNILVDDVALKALQRAFPAHKLGYTEDMLPDILATIKQGLPGKAGEQAADIIQKYFEFAKAKKELSAAYSDINLSKSSREDTLTETKALRVLYLGEELATQLFDKEDKETAFLYQTFEITTNKELTQEQKEAAQETLKTEYLASLVTNWEDRFNQYQLASNTIKQDQNLDQEESKDAIISLQKESFTIDELKIIRRANVRL